MRLCELVQNLCLSTFSGSLNEWIRPACSNFLMSHVPSIDDSSSKTLPPMSYPYSTVCKNAKKVCYKNIFVSWKAPKFLVFFFKVTKIFTPLHFQHHINCTIILKVANIFNPFLPPKGCKKHKNLPRLKVFYAHCIL